MSEDINSSDKTQEPQKPAKQDLDAFWEEMDRLAARIGEKWKDEMDAVEAVRDVRRDL